MSTKFDSLASAYQVENYNLITVLEMAHASAGELTLDDIKALAQLLDVPEAQLAGVLSFYDMFTGSVTAPEKAEIKDCGILLRADYRFGEALSAASADPERILEEIIASGLKGRSGSGFPSGAKWKTVREAEGAERFVICNAGEGEPGTSKDLSLLRANPKAVLEGMAICGAVVGAERGWICIRDGYDDAVEAVASALEEIDLKGFEIATFVNPGAYVVGEETALINALEGHRGEARLKPPYPGSSGLGKMPTVINNVETFACVPYIVLLGADAFRRSGCEGFSGPKLFTVTGAVNRGGVYESTAACTVRELCDQAGGPVAGREIKGFQIGGGGSGAILPAEKMEMKLDPASCSSAGAALGTGAVCFFDTNTNAAQVALDSIRFMARESCGHCTPCRFGLERLASILEKLISGTGEQDDLAELSRLAAYVKANSRCALGQSAVGPLISAMDNFPDDFLGLVKEAD